VCPQCKNSLGEVMYVDTHTYYNKGTTGIQFVHMNDKELKATSSNKTENENKIHALYENEAVKSYIYHCTAPYCYDCDKEFRLYTEYK